MSRAYRIRVKESVARDIRGEDCIETRLEILEVLPPEQTENTGEGVVSGGGRSWRG